MSKINRSGGNASDALMRASGQGDVLQKNQNNLRQLRRAAERDRLRAARKAGKLRAKNWLQ